MKVRIGSRKHVLSLFEFVGRKSQVVVVNNESSAKHGALGGENEFGVLDVDNLPDLPEEDVQPKAVVAKVAKKQKKRPKKAKKEAVAKLEVPKKLGDTGPLMESKVGEVGSGIVPLVARPEAVQNGVVFSENATGLDIDNKPTVATAHETAPKVQGFKNIQTGENDFGDSDRCHGVQGENVVVNKSSRNSKSSMGSGDKGVELIDLRQYINEGKRGEYVCSGLCVIGDLVEPSDEYLLNFTHRSAHGNDHDFAEHGKFDKLAKKQLDRLQTQYPTVLSEPTYPIDRTHL